ncbi:ATP-dependent sacrificial sulfur transferase LarE [Modestobacter sp. I12A-02628]|uniref:ATP-dependent sacrificial sulfur transferase LarE n=1 Tax=Goekera deserti TaxID=2497753 RepID=A0A7K3WHI3_9ACTN|nr:ATP-dependent sacrificial sulfur transferase LarE [Goekera deserti]MPQ97226.1 ATP-dependent sacrificial sulfur transferase LarE [Goekera deserti]NDI50264.1 ATP-dependent sacrificial sulfur transferase LarE [Goekera deserti]NEL55832.1 ATP-dependent sacrificial sulfur transferase LarE [Goekera deserti]
MSVLPDPGLDGKLAALHDRLAPLPGVLVAFSGGVDSGVVLAAAVRALGADRVVAATAVSPSLPLAEREAAAAFAAGLGVRHEQPRTDELAREGYRANAGDRCFFCKAELIDVLGPVAGRLGITDVVTGTNADDVRAGFRPGIRAATERGAWAPLAGAGLTKDDVRAAARRWALPLADKPAAACLASRIAYGVPVSAERLARVEAAEVALRAALADAGLPVRDLRVRDLGAPDGGDTARVEVDRELLGALAGRPELLAVVTGFDRVELDPRGFRSGSMNELLPDPVRYR